MALAGYGVRATARLAMHPRAFSAPGAFDAEVEALVAVLEEVRPQVVVSYAEDGGYGHPDHVRAHEITKAAVAEVPARLLYAVVGRGTLDAGLAALGAIPFRMPVADELPSVPDAAVTTRLDVRDQHARRIAAMRAHATQVVVAPDERSFAMSNGVAQPDAARRGVHRGRRSPQRRPLRGRRWLRAWSCSRCWSSTACSPARSGWRSPRSTWARCPPRSACCCRCWCCRGSCCGRARSTGGSRAHRSSPGSSRSRCSGCSGPAATRCSRRRGSRCCSSSAGWGRGCGRCAGCGISRRSGTR